jgi:two-component system C4-dicarboxylate transport sensor histidine kinase DctB
VIESSEQLDNITQVLVRVAGGDFEARAPREHSGDPWDVLAFLVNATAEEVAQLVSDLQSQRQELETARAQLIQAEKLALLGQLAGGVAHELNQPLTAILALTELLLEHERPRGEEQKDVELILSAARKMGRIVSAVRTFGRDMPLSLESVDVRRPVEDALVLMAETLRSASVQVDLTQIATVPKVLADVDSIGQVFINLIANARDALEAAVPSQQRRLAIHIGSETDKVLVTVSDNGPGVSVEVASRIFDPFFSTKPVGRGTGLGLAISHGIVEKHGGSLRYDRASLGGACFTVMLPVGQV